MTSEQETAESEYAAPQNEMCGPLRGGLASVFFFSPCPLVFFSFLHRAKQCRHSHAGDGTGELCEAQAG